MSKKSIMFRMPAREAAPSEHQDIPAVRPEVSEDAPASDSQPDQWVEHRNSGPFAAPAPIPSTTFRPRLAPTLTASFDVTAERSLEEVMFLGMFVPPLLGWFWLYHAMNRMARTWAN